METATPSPATAPEAGAPQMRKCACGCGESFEVVKPWQRFRSDSCRHTYHRRQVLLPPVAEATDAEVRRRLRPYLRALYGNRGRFRLRLGKGE